VCDVEWSFDRTIRALSEHVQKTFRAFSEHFQKTFRAFSEHLRVQSNRVALDCDAEMGQSG
jgi:hypothetical protein